MWSNPLLFTDILGLSPENGEIVVYGERWTEADESLFQEAMRFALNFLQDHLINVPLGEVFQADDGRYFAFGWDPEESKVNVSVYNDNSGQWYPPVVPPTKSELDDKRILLAAESADLITDFTVGLAEAFVPLPPVLKAYRMARWGARGGKAATKVLRLLTPLGRGSTGRTVAKDLTEQMVMKEIMSNPTMGREIIRNLGDPRWSGWSKMSWRNAGVEIHYVAKYENGVLVAVDDFKFIGGF
jgi:hypothetical protein